MTERDYKWDNLKFFLIFCVVLGHIADIYANISPITGYIRFFIYTFHMPLFVFISGLFSKSTINKNRYDKIFSYFVLYIFIKILNFVARWIAEGKMPAFRLFYEGSTPWYAFCLFAFCLITIFAKKLNPKYVLILSVVLSLIAGFDNRVGDHFCLSRLIYYYPVFFLGYCLDPKEVKENLKGRNYKIFSVTFILISIVLIIISYEYIDVLKYMFTGRNSYHDVFVANLPWAFLVRLFCYLFSFVIGCSIISLTPDKKCFISKIGSRSLQIYILHYPLKFLYFGLINDKYKVEQLFISKIVLYVFVVSVLLMIICSLPFWKKPIDKVLRG